jgi:Mrp family chromosome partitioning ATPase
MEQLIVQLKNQADLIIIDSPPNLVSDAAALATQVDGVILVVQPGKTQIPAVVSLTDQLKRINVNTIGVVFNRIPRSRSYYYYKYYAPYTSGEYRQNGYFEEENGDQL